MKRIALVTGAASGIGEATARTLARENWHVVVCDRNGTGAEKAAVAIRHAGGSSEHVILDITNISEIQAAARELVGQHGLIEAVVVNAGISGDGIPFEAVTEQAYDSMMAVNMKGHFFLLQALVPAMKRSGRGSIVLMSSMFALIGHSSMAHYTAAKGGLLALSKALAAELGPAGIRVNAVAPGLIRTPMTEANTGGNESIFSGRAARIPLRRLATMQDVANTVSYLVSPAAAAMTGQTLSPSGGEAFTD